jgi:hypothetical protein
VPTALSWTETSRAIRDVGHLSWFRSAATKRRTASRFGIAIITAITTLAATLPAYLEVYRTDDRVRDVLLLLPSAIGAFLVINVLSGIASGGGRELLSREQGVAFPVSPTTDHLGALLLTPLNVAWLVQSWTLLGAMSFGNGPGGLWGAQLVVVLWIAVATCAAQVVAWVGETVRRGPAGILIMRLVGVALAVAAGALYVVGEVGATLDALPSTQVVLGALSAHSGNWDRYAITVAVLLLVIPVLVALGAGAAHLAARRYPRDELRLESETHSPRPLSSTTFLGLVRIDRASVWRVVPMRRGIVFLAFGPGVVGVAGDLDWAQLTILPGLVASGGALLFGVNMWCLEGRGVLWRESLPISPGSVFSARITVLLEFLMLSSGFTILLSSLRAGVPTSHELASILATWLVVIMQVVSASARWSLKKPFAVDLRSARATPAPPGVMVGYSARLAVCTTFTSLIFSGLARVPAWELSVLVALPFLAWSTGRVVMARADWLDPVTRVGVVTTVAG